MLPRWLRPLPVLVSLACLPALARADVDATGRWRIAVSLPSGGSIVMAADFVQSATALDVTAAATGEPLWTGTIDPLAGGFALTGSVPGACAPSHFDGTVAANGLTLSGITTVSFESSPGNCVSAPLFTNGQRMSPDCGNGVLDDGEACDDGNLVEGDGCTTLCKFEQGCPQIPLPGCFRSTQPQKSKLTIKALSVPQPGLFASGFGSWSWPRGEDVPADALGDPTSVTRYDVCVYDLTGASGQATLLMRATAEPGGTCPTQDCWRARGSGFAYRNRDPLGSRFSSLLILPGTGGKAKAKLRFKYHGLPSMPLSDPVRLLVQLKTDTLQCWETAYETPGVKANAAKRFVAVGSP
jgi:cysteine-rich repeat protein